MPGELLEGATSGRTVVPPPFNEEEVDNSTPGISSEAVGRPLQSNGRRTVFRRALGGLLVVGFGVLFFFLALEFVQTINLLLTWPAWVGWPVLGVLFALVIYAVYRLLRILWSIRRMPIIDRLEPGELNQLSGGRKEAIRDQLLKQLDYLRNQGLPEGVDIEHLLDRLESEARSHPAGEWLNDYNRLVLGPLGIEARRKVRQIALTAGASAALSPWRILDAIVAFNGAIQSAHEVLKIHGIRPDQSVAVAFAFDTFLSTFLAVVVEDVSSDLVDSLTAQVSAETGAAATKALAPKIAEGLTTAVFVRRLGNRMVRRLHPFPN
ncbi:MAG: DUF697 domain-containing protein [Verrucomicrobiota bacterium]